MTRSDEPVVGCPRGKGGGFSVLGKRREIQLCSALLLLVIGAIPAFALADEPSAPDDLSLTLLEKALDSQGVNESQLTDPQAAEELPHRNLERAEAVELTEAVFEPVLQSAAGPFQNLEVERFLSDTAAIVPASSGVEGFSEQGSRNDSDGADFPEERFLLESTIPLRTDGSDGPQEPIDLSLDASGAAIEPQTPLVEVELPKALGDGIYLPETGIGIALSGAPAERSPSVLGEAVLTYPNVATDTDFSAAPTPTGVETFMTLRSSAAPQSQTYDFDLPAGATLNQGGEGAEVKRGEDTILKILAPTAIDASGNNVLVNLSVSGQSMTLKVSPTDDTPYPILVDPIFESYDWFGFHATTGMDTWHSQSSVSGLVPRIIYPNPVSTGLEIEGKAGHYLPGDQAGWYYWVPRLKEEEALGRTPPAISLA